MQRISHSVTEGREAHAVTSSEYEPVRHPPSWFALQLRSNFEFSVAGALELAGIEQFLPTWTETVSWTDRQKQTTRPLFPGYIFARFTPAEISRVLRTRGVITVLGNDNQPAAIPTEEINALRAAVSSRSCAPCPYVAGEQVRVTTGPFAGVSGVICRVKGASCLTIPVQILGRAVAVEIDAADVETAPQEEK